MYPVMRWLSTLGFSCFDAHLDCLLEASHDGRKAQYDNLGMLVGIEDVNSNLLFTFIGVTEDPCGSFCQHSH